MKEPMHKRMYKESPKLERDADTGRVKVGKNVQTNEGAKPMENGDENGIPMTVRHAHERQATHSKQMVEHSAHEIKGGSKVEMHKRHIEEIKVMHKKHEKEMGGK